jgi:hypothetical protein
MYRRFHVCGVCTICILPLESWCWPAVARMYRRFHVCGVCTICMLPLESWCWPAVARISHLDLVYVAYVPFVCCLVQHTVYYNKCIIERCHRFSTLGEKKQFFLFSTIFWYGSGYYQSVKIRMKITNVNTHCKSGSSSCKVDIHRVWCLWQS